MFELQDYIATNTLQWGITKVILKIISIGVPKIFLTILTVLTVFTRGWRYAL